MTDRLIAWLHEGVDLLGDWLRDAPQSRLEPRAEDLQAHRVAMDQTANARLYTPDFGTPPPSVLNPATRRAVEALQDELIASQLAPTPKRRGRPRKYEPRVPIQEIHAQRVAAPAAANERMSNDAQTYHCTHCGRVLPATVRQFHEPNCAAAEKGYTTHESRKPDGSSTL